MMMMLMMNADDDDENVLSLPLAVFIYLWGTNARGAEQMPQTNN